MCIIFYAPNRKSLPTAAQIETAWAINPDGAGFAYFDHAEAAWRVKKGLLSLPQLFDALDAVKPDELILHLRLATHGAATAAYTHPFAVNADYNQAQRCATPTHDALLFHNGVISGFGSEHLSDTLDYATTLALIPRDSDRIKLLESTGCKYAYVNRNHDVTLIGHWSQHSHGFWQSHEYWERLSPQRWWTHNI